MGANNRDTGIDILSVISSVQKDRSETKCEALPALGHLETAVSKMLGMKMYSAHNDL